MTPVPRNTFGFLKPIENLPDDLPETDKMLLADTTRILTHEEYQSLSRNSQRLLGEQERAAQRSVQKHLIAQYSQTHSHISEDQWWAMTLGSANWWTRGM